MEASETNTAEWIGSGGRAFPMMLAAIRGARVSVCLEMFIFHPGVPGDAFREALVAAAMRGVRVSVLLDAVGSSGLSDSYLEPLAKAGGGVRWFNRVRTPKILVRDHRKILVCDDAVAFVGGFNIAPEYDGDGVTDGWRDTGLRVAGPAAAALGKLFASLYQAHADRPPWMSRWRRRVWDDAGGCEPGLRILPVSPGHGPSGMSKAFIGDLARAKRVTLVTPYFLPSAAIRRELRKAARRGASVRVVLPAQSDVWLSQLAARRLYSSLLRSGVGILEYEPRVLHAKVFLIDNAVYTGSSNLDPRSLYLNYELMLRLEDPRVVEAARADVEDMVSRSRKIDRVAWGRSRGWWDMTREWLAFSIMYRLDPWLTGWLAKPGR